MKKNNKFIIIAVSCLLASISCVRQEMEVALDCGDNLERVPVTLSLTISQIEDGTPGTKGTMEPEADATDSDSQIKDFVVLQFNGTSSTATLAGGQAYFDHWPLNGYREQTDPQYDENDVLTLVASSSANTVVVLANTFGRITIGNNITLGNFLSNITNYTTISDLSGVFSSSGGNDYLRLSGSAILETVGGETVHVDLKRNVAKIVVNVTNTSTGDNKVTFSKVQMRDINGKYYYLTHNALFTDPYEPGYPYRFDNDMEDFPAAGNTGTEVTYTYYVPANLRGTTSSTTQSTKPIGAPEGATCFSLYGTYGASNTPIVYTYYLGENLTNDFNLKPNYKYTYNITISAKGNADYDHCIEDLKEVRFSTDANCYMVHPPKVAGQSRIYSIPVRRAAVFWNAEGVNQGLYGASTAAGYEQYALSSSTTWEPVIIWSDFNMSSYSDFFVNATGTGFDPANPAHTQPYIKLRISNGMKGNVVVGMKSTSGTSNGAILWSWHIWITDYDPDVSMTPVAHQYLYDVPGGEIHRYNNETWNTGAYAKGFAMDRNLGALSSGYSSTKGNGFLYQYGRKDPLPATTKFFFGGQSPSVDVYNNYRIRSDNVPGTEGKNIRYSVLHPEMLIYGPSTNSYRWTVVDDDLGDGDDTSCLFNDKKWNRTGDPDRHELNKSFYDPCPPGWKMPVKTCWDGFNKEDDSNSATQTYTTVWNNATDMKGRYYYPEGYCNREATGRIFYPTTGWRWCGDMNLSQTTTAGYIMPATANGSSHSYMLYYNSTTMSLSGNFKSYGFAVRCVRE